jgi:hypothetical protein
MELTFIGFRLSRGGSSKKAKQIIFSMILDQLCAIIRLNHKFIRSLKFTQIVKQSHIDIL